MHVFSFTGNLARDAELRTTQAGKPVCGFTVAHETGWGDRKRTEFIDCSLWGDRGEKLAKHLTKGLKVAVTGEVSPHAYTTQAGELRTSLRVSVRDITLMGGGRKADEPAGVHAPLDDDMPF